MNALILAAGHGTRLRPLTDNFAKPALPIVGVPSIWYSAYCLYQQLGLQKINVNVHHAKQSILTVLKDPILKKFAKIDFKISDESDEILGTAGCLWKIRDTIDDDFLLVTNGDSIAWVDWPSLIEHHKKNNALLTMQLKDVSQNLFEDKYTEIQVNKSGQIIGLGKKKKLSMVFIGSYIISKKVIDRLPKGVSDFKTYILDPLIKEKKAFGKIDKLEWLDVGTVSGFVYAQSVAYKIFPEFLPLIKLKMRTLSKDVWVPSIWPKNPEFEVLGPSVMCEKYEDWKSLNIDKFGPNFYGILPPKNASLRYKKNRLVFGQFQNRLK